MAGEHLDVAQAQALTITLSQRYRFLDPVQCRDLPSRAFAGQGQRYRAGSSAQVEHLGWRCRLQLKRRLDQKLGIRARNQRVGCHFQVEQVAA